MKKFCSCLFFSIPLVFQFAFTTTASTIAMQPVAETYLQNGNSSSNYSIKILAAPAQTYGYEIYQGAKLVVRQLNIPGLPGIKGFKRKADAEKVAALVVQKLTKGIMPPTIDRKEMENLDVQF